MAVTSTTSSPPPAAAGFSRRGLLARAGLMAGAAAVGTGLLDLDGGEGHLARGALRFAYDPSDGRRFVVNDNDILQFALNTEYVEGEFYNRAANGVGLPEESTTGIAAHGAKPNAAAAPGAVTTYSAGPVPFEDNATGRYLKQFFQEVAAQEIAHLNLLRTVLGKKVPARPQIDLAGSFTTAMRAAGVIGPTDTFDPFASQKNLLLAAYFQNDIGVTAYVGASPYIAKPANLQAAAGILGVEAYHAGESRTLVFAMGQADASFLFDANMISVARNHTASLSGAPAVTDEGVTGAGGAANIIPTDGNSLAFARAFPAILSLFYLNTSTTLSPSPGGFTPQGFNSRIR